MADWIYSEKPMHYTIAGLAQEGEPVQRAIDALITQGIDRSRISISSTRETAQPGVAADILIAVKTNNLEEQQLLLDTLQSAGARSVTTSEESAVLKLL